MHYFTTDLSITRTITLLIASIIVTDILSRVIVEKRETKIETPYNEVSNNNTDDLVKKDINLVVQTDKDTDLKYNDAVKTVDTNLIGNTIVFDTQTNKDTSIIVKDNSIKSVPTNKIVVQLNKDTYIKYVDLINTAFTTNINNINSIKIIYGGTSGTQQQKA